MNGKQVLENLKNGTGSLITRVLVTIFVAFAMFAGNQLSNDIRNKFSEITIDVRDIKNNMIKRVEFDRELGEIHRVMKIYHRYDIQGGE